MPLTQTRRLRSPGLLKKHYAPKAKLVTWKWRDQADFTTQLASFQTSLTGVHVLAYDQVPRGVALGRVCVMPPEATAFARRLYAELHRCDELGAKLIVVEALPKAAAWRAIRDRLERAAASTSGS
jgi:L-threonylcarbamoyladenylate synthase